MHIFTYLGLSCVLHSYTAALITCCERYSVDVSDEMVWIQQPSTELSFGVEIGSTRVRSGDLRLLHPEELPKIFDITGRAVHCAFLLGQIPCDPQVVCD